MFTQLPSGLTKLCITGLNYPLLYLPLGLQELYLDKVRNVIELDDEDLPAETDPLPALTTIHAGNLVPSALVHFVRFHRLRSLRIHESASNENEHLALLRILKEAGPSLRELVLTPSISGPRIDDNFLDVLGQYNSALESLVIKGRGGFTNNGIETLLNRCKGLRVLKLDNWPVVLFYQYLLWPCRDLSGALVDILIAKGGTNTEEGGRRWDRLGLVGKQFITATLERLLNGCPGLQSLNLCNTGIAIKEALDLMERFPHVRIRWAVWDNWQG